MVGSRFHRWGLGLVGVVIVVALSTHALREPLREFGDGREYILQTQAIVFDGSLSVDPATRGEYWNRTNPFGVTLPLAPSEESVTAGPFGMRQCAPGYGSLYLSNDGRYRFAHTWMYSLIVAPFYAIAHIVFPGPNEYLVFRVLNIALLFIPLAMLVRLRPTWSSLALVTLVLASPLTPHLQWAHSEIFCCSAVLFAFVSLQYPRLRWLGPLALGLGAAQNIPIALFFPLHLWLQFRRERPIRVASSLRRLLPYVCGAALPVLMMAYYYRYFGVFNVIAASGGADFSMLTVNRMLSVFFSPQIGVFWYFPAAWLAVLIAWSRSDRWSVFFACASVVAVAALCSTTTNINSAQLSSPRYAVWFLAPLYCLPFLNSRRGDEYEGHCARAATLGGVVVAAGILLWLGTFHFIEGEWSRFYSVNRTDPRVAKLYRVTHFNDDIEPLVENIHGRELLVPHSFDGVYIWNLGPSQSVWIISKRAWMNMKALTVSGDISELEGSDALRDVFDIRRYPSGSLRLYPKSDAEFLSHPYWGRYLLLWVGGGVASAVSSVPVSLKK